MARRKRMQGFIKRGAVWHITTDPVTGRQKSTGCRDEEAALLWRSQRERLAADPAYAAAQTATLGEWVRKFLGSKEAAKTSGKLAEGSLQSINSKLANVARVLGENRALATIDTNLIDSYVARRRSECGHGDKPVGDYTIAREVQKLIAVLRHAKRRGAYPGDLQALAPDDLDGHYTPRERALTEDEVCRLIVAMPTRSWASLVAVCVSLGCRLSEAFRLRPEDIDLGAGVVWVDGRKTESSDRTLPIISGYRAMLEAAIPSLPIGEMSNVDRTFKLACKRSGIERCSPNDLRRTHSTLLGERGLGDDLVARLLGHKTTALAKRTYNRAKAMQLAPVAEQILAANKPLQLPGKVVQIDDSDRRKPKKLAENMLVYETELRPPEPKVPCSNHGWRADNTREPDTRNDVTEHDNARDDVRIHTNLLQSPSATAREIVFARRPAHDLLDLLRAGVRMAVVPC